MPYLIQRVVVSICFLLLGLSWPVMADENNCSKNNPACVQIGRWHVNVALGLGARSNPIEGSDTIPLIVVPQVSYYADRFFIDNLDLGYTLFENSKHHIHLLASPGYDRVFFQDDDVQNIFIDTGASVPGLEPRDPPTEEELEALRERERNVTYLGGVEWSYGIKQAHFQFNYLHELTGEHDGDEARVAVSVPIYSNNGQLAATLGATWKSARLVSYYYGAKKLYEPGSAVNPFAKISYSRPLNEQWTLKIFGHYQKMGSSIEQSPIVAEGEVLTVFVGGVYSF